MAITTDHLAAIAEFNQNYGALLRDIQRSSLQTTTTSAASRVLLALGRRARASSSVLSDDLAMDRAQLSRLVLKLTDEGYLVSLPSVDDRRVGNLVLTREGDAAYVALEAEQTETLTAMVQHLSPADLDRLVGAMDLIQDLLDQD